MLLQSCPASAHRAASGPQPEPAAGASLLRHLLQMTLHRPYIVVILSCDALNGEMLLSKALECFWTFKIGSVCKVWYFTERNQCSLLQPKERVRSSVVWFFQRAVGFVIPCMAVSYGGRLGTMCHDKPFPRWDFFLLVCSMLHFYSATLLLSWQTFGSPNFFFEFLFLQHWQHSVLIMLEGLYDFFPLAARERRSAIVPTTTTVFSSEKLSEKNRPEPM